MPRANQYEYNTLYNDVYNSYRHTRYKVKLIHVIYVGT